jgi:polar amino acid transport system substrate-binding protein
MFLTRLRFTICAAMLALGALGLTACGGNGKSGTTTSPTASVDPKVAAMVPAEVKRKGTLTVAADATYAPDEFIAPDGKTVEGMDAELAKSLGDVMGLKVKVVNATFDSIIPGLASHKFDLGISSFTDTKEREKVIDFVTYFTAGTSFFLKSSGGPAINGLADLCGHKVAVEKGTTQQDDATAQDKKCKSAGKPGVDVLTFPDQNGANLALASGRAEVGMADSPVAAYQVKKSNGQFKVTGETYGSAPYGIAIPKDSGMAKPVLAALKALMANGAYKAILAKWGIESGAITNPKIDGATS